MKAIFHYDAGPPLKTRFTSLAGGFAIEACSEEDEDRLASLLFGAEVWLHILKPITAALIEKGPLLRLIQKIGVGVNTIDLGAAQAPDALDRSLKVAIDNMRRLHDGRELLHRVV